MKPDQKHPLLNELLSDDQLDDLRGATLEQGLRLVRRRRRLRRVARTSGWIGILVALAIAIPTLFWSQPASDHATQTTDSEGVILAHAAVEPPVESDADTGVRFLTDEQLLALFPGRPVALIGPAGDQQLVFLDEPILSQSGPAPLDL
jgi:hypothetical protein